jgi:DNA-binding NarL/FixJ family response regulator
MSSTYGNSGFLSPHAPQELTNEIEEKIKKLIAGSWQIKAIALYLKVRESDVKKIQKNNPELLSYGQYIK